MSTETAACAQGPSPRSPANRRPNHASMVARPNTRHPKRPIPKNGTTIRPTPVIASKTKTSGIASRVSSSVEISPTSGIASIVRNAVRML